MQSLVCLGSSIFTDEWMNEWSWMNEWAKLRATEDCLLLQYNRVGIFLFVLFCFLCFKKLFITIFQPYLVFKRLCDNLWLSCYDSVLLWLPCYAHLATVSVSGGSNLLYVCSAAVTPSVLPTKSHLEAPSPWAIKNPCLSHIQCWPLKPCLTGRQPMFMIKKNLP